MFFAFSDYRPPLPRPEVYPSSITHNSVELYWPKQSYVGNLSYTLQLQMVDMYTEWRNHGDSTILPTAHLHITNLHPFLTYKVIQYKINFTQLHCKSIVQIIVFESKSICQY